MRKATARWQDGPDESLTFKHTLGPAGSATPYVHQIDALVNGKPRGQMLLHNPGAMPLLDGKYSPGEIRWVTVDDDLRGRGVARAMVDHAKSIGLSPVHSPGQTDDGRGWAKHIPLPTTTAAVPDPETVEDDEHSDDGMIALIPSKEYLAKLAVEGGEPEGQIHLTLTFFQGASTWDDDKKGKLLELVDSELPEDNVEGEVFAHAEFNPSGDKSCVTYLVSQLPVDIEDFRDRIIDAMKIEEKFPQWIPHITAEYGTDIDKLEYTGPVSFDIMRVSIGTEQYDFPLTSKDEPKTAQKVASKWSDTDDEKLTFTYEPAGPSPYGTDTDHFINAHVNGNPVGQLKVSPDSPNADPSFEPGEVSNIDVNKYFRGRGIGTAMMEHAQTLGLNPHHSELLVDDGAGFAAGTPQFNA